MITDPNKTTKDIDAEIEHILIRLEELSPDSEEYTNAAKNLDTLCACRSYKTNTWLNYEVLIPAAVNLFGILLVLNYEKLGIVTSKAMSMVGRGK
jgi:hypothetical protein